MAMRKNLQGQDYSVRDDTVTRTRARVVACAYKHPARACVRLFLREITCREREGMTPLPVYIIYVRSRLQLGYITANRDKKKIQTCSLQDVRYV